MTFRHAEMGSKEKVLSNVYVTQNLPQIGREEGIGMDGLIEDFGIDKRMCVRKLGKKEKGKLFKWDKRVKIVEELKVLQKRIHETRWQDARQAYGRSRWCQFVQFRL